MKEKETIYVHEITTLWSADGEVWIETDTGQRIFFNADTLFNDLPTLYNLALKERNNQTEMIKEQMKEVI